MRVRFELEVRLVLVLPADEVPGGPYVRQGDLFQDVPLGYPWPPDAVNHSAGARKYLSGPFEGGFGMREMEGAADG